MKSYFQRGDSPTEDQFAELIDSVTNIHEDGKVTATASDGVRLFPAGKSGVAATVFTDDPDQGGSEPLWRIALDGENGLRIQDDKGKTVLTIDRDRNVTACPFFPETLVGLVWPCQDTLATHGRENPSPDKKPVDRERCGGHLLPYRNPLGIIGDRAYG